MEGLLARIVERTLEDVHARRGKIPRSELEARARARIASRRPFAAALKRGAMSDPVRFIAEAGSQGPQAKRVSLGKHQTGTMPGNEEPV